MHAIYTVIEREGQWKMVVNSKEFGHFASEHLAIKMAIETAYEAGRFNGGGAQVVLQGTGKTAEILWTYGQDPFPAHQFS